MAPLSSTVSLSAEEQVFFFFLVLRSINLSFPHEQAAQTTPTRVALRNMLAASICSLPICGGRQRCLIPPMRGKPRCKVEAEDDFCRVDGHCIYFVTGAHVASVLQLKLLRPHVSGSGRQLSQRNGGQRYFGRNGTPCASPVDRSLVCACLAFKELAAHRRTLHRST